MHNYIYLNIKYEKRSLRLAETFYQTPYPPPKMNTIGSNLVVHPMTIVAAASRPFPPSKALGRRSHINTS